MSYWAYRDRAQIVTKFGRYGQFNIGIGLAGDGMRLELGSQDCWTISKIPRWMPMQMYLHDCVMSFEFVLNGELTGDAVHSLEQAWITATSILNGKEVVVDVSALTSADARGFELLCRMKESGARMSATRPPQSEEFIRSLGVPVAALPQRFHWPWILGVRRLFGFPA